MNDGMKSEHYHRWNVKRIPEFILCCDRTIKHLDIPVTRRSSVNVRNGMKRGSASRDTGSSQCARVTWPGISG